MTGVNFISSQLTFIFYVPFSTPSVTLGISIRSRGTYSEVLPHCVAKLCKKGSIPWQVYDLQELELMVVDESITVAPRAHR